MINEITLDCYINAINVVTLKDSNGFTASYSIDGFTTDEDHSMIRLIFDTSIPAEFLHTNNIWQLRIKGSLSNYIPMDNLTSWHTRSRLLVRVSDVLMFVRPDVDTLGSVRSLIYNQSTINLANQTTSNNLIVEQVLVRRPGGAVTNAENIILSRSHLGKRKERDYQQEINNGDDIITVNNNENDVVNVEDDIDFDEIDNALSLFFPV